MAVARIVEALQGWGTAVEGLLQHQQTEAQLYQSGTWETSLPLGPSQEPSELRAVAERCQRVVANFAQGGPAWIVQLLQTMQAAIKALDTDPDQTARLRAEVQKRCEQLQKQA